VPLSAKILLAGSGGSLPTLTKCTAKVANVVKLSRCPNSCGATFTHRIPIPQIYLKMHLMTLHDVKHAGRESAKCGLFGEHNQPPCDPSTCQVHRNYSRCNSHRNGLWAKLRSRSAPISFSPNTQNSYHFILVEATPLVEAFLLGFLTYVCDENYQSPSAQLDLKKLFESNFTG
jgi:hypothetical protein